MNYNYYLVGGRKNSTTPMPSRGFTFDRGIIAEIDVNSGAVDVCCEYESPAEACPSDEPSVLFKAAYREADYLYTCTETEVIIFRVPDFEPVAYISLPCFNDLHFVRPTPAGTLLVVVTGLDMVMEITWNGEIIREWDVLGNPLWQRFSRDIDYRKVGCTKPHLAHPNYVFYYGDELWVNRLRQRDAICLTAPDRWIPIRTEENYQEAHCGSHDGIVHHGKVYFTTVNGHVVVADCESGLVQHDYNLNRGIKSLGWCRGIHVIDETNVIVGFTRLRPTRHAGHLSWLTSGIDFAKSSMILPTRIVSYDLTTGQIRWEHSLEHIGLDAIFSIHPVAATTNSVVPEDMASTHEAS